MEMKTSQANITPLRASSEKENQIICGVILVAQDFFFFHIFPLYLANLIPKLTRWNLPEIPAKRQTFDQDSPSEIYLHNVSVLQVKIEEGGFG